MSELKKYQRCMVMAGGGFRFGIYLGMHAAACEAGKPPDIVLASCGAAIAAALIQTLPDDARRKAWLGSMEMYRFWSSLQSTRHAAIHRALWGALRRRLSLHQAPRIPDLFQDCLFDVPASLPLPSLTRRPDGPAVAIVGGKLLFAPDEVGQARGTRKLFAETIFCPPAAAALLAGMPSPFSDEALWGRHAIAPELLTEVDMPLAEAVRISIADMYYFACHSAGPAHYTGGVVDLFPIEVARRLADEVVMEFKAPFNQPLAIPALRAVLGLDGNQRLRHVHGQRAEVWIDTSDISQALAKEQVRKQLQWRRNRIRLAPPERYEDYVQHIDAQWHYGYQRGMQAFASTPPDSRHGMRCVNRYNQAQASS